VRSQEEGPERWLGDCTKGRPRMVSFEKQSLTAVDVANPANQLLIEQNLPERSLAWLTVDPYKDRVEIEWDRQNVWPEMANAMAFRVNCR
jgi:hypothetical protein